MASLFGLSWQGTLGACPPADGRWISVAPSAISRLSWKQQLTCASSWLANGFREICMSDLHSREGTQWGSVISPLSSSAIRFFSCLCLDLSRMQCMCIRTYVCTHLSLTTCCYLLPLPSSRSSALHLRHLDYLPRSSPAILVINPCTYRPHPPPP